MSFGRASQSRDTTDYGWRPPTTFVDVLFLVLIFFVSIAAVRRLEPQIPVNLPASETGKGGGATQIVITVTRAGGIFVADQEYTLNPADAARRPLLQSTLAQLAQQSPGESVIIRGDQTSQLGLTVRIMDAAYKAGLRNVYLATIRPAGEL